MRENASESLGGISQILHWQTMPVTVLRWSTEGSSIFSGGRERVLVQYTLHHQGKWTRKFLPRLGSAVRHLSCSDDGSLIAVRLEDNSEFRKGFHSLELTEISPGLEVVSSQMEILVSVGGFVRSPGAQCAGLFCDRWGLGGLETLGSLWTNGRPGQLQCFSLQDKMTLFSVHFRQSFD